MPAVIDAHAVLQILWFLLISVLLVGYFILDGFDLGSGILSPFVAKTEPEKAIVRRAIGPIWDGNEVWLLTAGGALFAAFPPAYATSFSGFYLAIMLVLFGLIFRAVAIEYAARDAKWRKFWNGAFFVGSLLPALLFGAAIGNVIQGVVLNSHGDYVGGFFSLLNPFALLCAIMGLVTFIAHGASWLCLKAPLESLVRQRAIKLRSMFSIIQLVVFVLVSVYFFLAVYPQFGSDRIAMPVAFAAAVVCAVGWVLARLFMVNRNDLWAFLAGCLIPVALIGITAGSLFPNLIPAAMNPEGVVTYFFVPGAADTASSLTIFNSSNSAYTLTAMTIITCIGLPLVLLYHIVIYRTFRGRIAETEVETGGY